MHSCRGVRWRVFSRLKVRANSTVTPLSQPQQQQQQQPWPNITEHTEVAGQLEFKTGHMARFASGAVVLSHDQNAILGVVVSKQQSPPSSTTSTIIPFNGLALNVDFRQSAAAIGRIPTNYFRKEMQQTERDIIASRIIDRSIRAAFHPNYPHQTQVICNTLALDDGGDAIVLGVNAASAALAISEVPLKCPVAAVRVAIINGEVIVNPARELLKQSHLDMVLAGTDDQRILMIEMDGKEIDLEPFIESIHQGLNEIVKVIAAIKRLEVAVGNKKLEISNQQQQPSLPAEVFTESEGQLRQIFGNPTYDKISRDTAIQKIKEQFLLANPSLSSAHFTDLFKSLLNRWTFEESKRVDGRHFDEFRPLKIEVGIFDKLHGTSLFQRGQTQVFSTLTFDSPQSAFHPDSIAQLLGAQQRKSFMLHYTFPQFAVNDTGSGVGGSRREIGHGLLAEKALKHVIPAEFPYTIRLACQVLESNGSSSMASVCAGSLALMDAGVPISRPVAGVAIGMVVSNEATTTQTAFLVDQLGMEDYYGLMDFKIAGTANGFTAMQMDLKRAGISIQQLSEALGKGRLGINHVLSHMNACIDHPRLTFKSSAPVIETMDMASYKMGLLFRSSSYNAKLVAAETGVQLSVEDEGRLGIFAPNREKLYQAKQMIERIMEESADDVYTFGQLYKAEIVEIQENGVMVALRKGTRPIFMRNFDLSSKRVGHASALKLEVGKALTVQYFGRDPNGYHRLSRKTLQTMELPVINMK